jgi:glutathione S-transferase
MNILGRLTLLAIIIVLYFAVRYKVLKLYPEDPTDLQFTRWWAYLAAVPLTLLTVLILAAFLGVIRWVVTGEWL